MSIPPPPRKRERYDGPFEGEAARRFAALRMVAQVRNRTELSIGSVLRDADEALKWIEATE